MISKTAEYAVRACLWLAERPGEASTVHVIAESIRVPGKYLSKVMQLLGRAAIVRAQPGPGGGFSLNRDPAETCVLDVICAVDPLVRIKPSPAGLAEEGAGLRPFHMRLDQAAGVIEQSLRGCTLAALLQETTSSKTLKGKTP